MKNTEIIKTNKSKIACDGGKGSLGHPRIYITLEKTGKKACPYCGQEFEKEKE